MNLYHRLITDLNKLKLPTDEFDLYLRPYSKTFYGRYFPSFNDNKKPKIYIYPYRTANNILYPYSTVLYHTIHEVCHHLQYSDPNFKRRKGVMHDTNFYKLLEYYVNKAEQQNLLRKEDVRLWIIDYIPLFQDWKIIGYAL